jgi:ABC-type sulfate transport system permease subunit
VVEQRYQDFEQSTAYATSFLLAGAAIIASSSSR